MKSVAFFTNKGGVGKTTLVCNLAAYLANIKKKKVLLVDADPQTNATQYTFNDDVLEEIYDKKPHLQSTLWRVLYLKAKGTPSAISTATPSLLESTYF